MGRIRRPCVAPAWLAATVLAAAAPAAGATGDASPIDAWDAVQDEALAQLRGGLDLGALIANFSIERLVRIDGEVVARSRLVLSEVGNLSRGHAPGVELAGNLASLIQIGQNNAIIAQDEAARVRDQAGVNGILPGAPGGQAAAHGGSAAPTASGSVGASASATGQFGPGLAAGVNAANGELPGQSASAAGPATQASAAAGTTGAPSQGPTLGQTATPGQASGTRFTVAALPAANAGRTVAVTNLPDAAALMTTIQNSVEAIRIDTETRIQATMSSLAALRASNLATLLQQQQALDALRR